MYSKQNKMCYFFILLYQSVVFPSSSYRKFVKEQKQVQEDISRMSSKAISKVQDDIKNLKQLLSVSASGLQRQALAIDKLKLETAQVKTSASSHTSLTVIDKNIYHIEHLPQMISSQDILLLRIWCTSGICHKV